MIEVRTLSGLSMEYPTIYLCMVDKLKHTHIKAEDELNDVIGGFVYVVEKNEDLAQIEVFQSISDADGHFVRHMNITEKADSFDDAHWTLDGKYVMIYKVTSDAGGNLYAIPKEFVTQNIIKSIELTRG